MAILKGHNNNKFWQRCGKTGTVIHCWWGCTTNNGRQYGNSSKKKKLEIELPYNPVILFLGIYPQEHKTGYSRDTCTLMFIASLFTIAKLWKQPRCPTTDEWIKKLWYIYTMECYSAIRNNDMWLCNWRTSCMLSEVSQYQKHKSQVFSHVWKIDPKINVYTKTSMFIYKLRCRTCL
jgi:hypothetical protein